MTREEFKKRWESNEDAGGITFDDISDCAKEWKLFSTPRCHNIDTVIYKVLKEANCIDKEFKPCVLTVEIEEKI